MTRFPALLLGSLFGLLSAAPLGGQTRVPRVAVILDQESARFAPMIDAFLRQVRGFFRSGEIELLPPMAGDGTTVGIQALLSRAMTDSTVHAVVALGAVGSHLLARTRPTKPAIAAAVIDASWQGIPRQGDVSGVPNLVYVDQSYPVDRTLADFHKLVAFKRLAVILDRHQLKAIPQLEAGAAGMVTALGAEAVILPAPPSVKDILESLPDSVDAVYLAPLPSLTDADLSLLLAGLNARRLPTLSYLADPDVAAGALASYEPLENWQRRTRRVAVNLQRILAGENAGRLPVQLVSAPRLTLNLATARRIGFSPGRSLLTDAELVGVDSSGPADSLSLAESMRLAATVNLDLAATDLQVAAGDQNVKRARSALLPQVESRLTQTFTREGTAQASFGQQPERMLDGGLTFTMPLFNEDAWSGYGVERHRQQAREAQRDEQRLDVVLSAATAYLNVLRSRTLAQVRRSDLARTRSNLEVARLREGVGSSSRADIYRWQGEVADARRELIAAESQVRVAALELKQVLHWQLDRPLGQLPVGLGDPALLAADTTILRWFDDPLRFQALSQFLIDEAFRSAPELARSDASIAAQKREHAAASRAFYLPSVALQGGLSSVLNRGGEGSTAPTLPSTSVPVAPDMSWQVRLQVSMPLFTGMERTATRAQTQLELERLQVQRESVRLAVDQRVRASLETAASSYAAIGLTRDAAEAAGRNYELVSDAYARGSASITALLDAQTAALTSEESAANAVHDFLLSLMRVERAMGTFGTLQPAEQRAAFLNRLRALKEN